MSRTNQEIVDQTNAIARIIYSHDGYEVPNGYRFDKATHPQETSAWSAACDIQLYMTQTDPNDALQEIEDDTTCE